MDRPRYLPVPIESGIRFSSTKFTQEFHEEDADGVLEIIGVKPSNSLKLYLFIPKNCKYPEIMAGKFYSTLRFIAF
jgi:hypothetical protein